LNTGKKEHEKNHGIDYRVGDETPNLKNNEKLKTTCFMMKSSDRLKQAVLQLRTTNNKFQNLYIYINKNG